MAYYQTPTIWDLPAKPLLPVGDVKDSVLVTIWLVVCLVSAICLSYLLNRKKSQTCQELRAVMYGTLCLAIWYITVVADRWMRHYHTPVPYSYILAGPLSDLFRISSTVLLLWGTYTVVWKELEDQFTIWKQGVWWFAGKFLIFVVTLMAIFYAVLGIALSAVWLEFFSLNAIADIAGKRTDFEMAMAAFFFIFGLLTLVEATVARLHSYVVHGQFEWKRHFLWLAAVFLFARSISELKIVSKIYKGTATRNGTKVDTDMAYGLITSLYLITICVMAASTFDSGGRQAKMVASDVRHYVLEMLEAVTNGARSPSPPFESILREVERNLHTVLSSGPLTGNLDMEDEYKRKAALDCIAQLRAKFGTLDPNEGHDYNARPPSTLSTLASLFGPRSKSAQRLNMSSTTLRSSTNRPGYTSPDAVDGSTAASRATIREEPRGYGLELSLYSTAPNTPAPVLASLQAGGSSSTRYNSAPPRWAPSPSSFQEPSRPYQSSGILPPVFHNQSPSPPLHPPPVVRKPVAGAASSTRSNIATSSPFRHPVSVQQQPPPNASHHDSHRPIPTPQPVPLPSNPATNARGEHIPSSSTWATALSTELRSLHPTSQSTSQGPSTTTSQPPSTRQPASTSPSATAGSSYQYLKAQRAARASAPPVTALGGGYQPRLPGTNTSTTPSSSYSYPRYSSPTSAPQIRSTAAPTTAGPPLVPRPMPPPPPRATYYASAYDDMASTSDGDPSGGQPSSPEHEQGN